MTSLHADILNPTLFAGKSLPGNPCSTKPSLRGWSNSRKTYRCGPLPCAGAGDRYENAAVTLSAVIFVAVEDRMRKSVFIQCRKFAAVGLAREGASGSIMITMYRLLVFRLLESPRARVGGDFTAIRWSVG